MNLPAVQSPTESEAPASSAAPAGDISWKDLPRVMGSGVAMGTADVVPGVSGGTMAVACGIYMELLGAINSINARALQALARLRLRDALQEIHWRFMLSLGIGIVMAFVVMLRVVGLPRLLQEHPEHVFGVFFGLVLGSVFVLGRRISGWSVQLAGMLALGAALGFGIVNLVPVSTPESPVFVFFCGMIAICAMLLPGISGSFVLLILGKYEYVMGSVERLLRFDLSALAVVVPFALGCLVGIASFSRVLTWLLRRWQQPMMALLTGLLVGSLWRIWPFQVVVEQEVRGKVQVISATPQWPASFDGAVLALMVGGLLAVAAVELIAARRQVS